MSRPEVSNYSRTTKASREVSHGDLSLGKLVFLGIIAMALSAFGPVSLFAPVPLAIAFLLYGKGKTLLLSGVISGALFVMAWQNPLWKDLYFVASAFSLAFVYAFLISQVIERKVHPVKGLIRSGLLLMAFFLLILVTFQLMSEAGVRGIVEKGVYDFIQSLKGNEAYTQIIAAGGEQALMLQSFTENPQKLVQQIINWSFATIFVATFLGLWIGLLMVLRNAPIWRSKWKYSYGLKDLLNFHVPDFFIWPVILGLGLVLGGDHLWKDIAPAIGMNFLYCIGVFYFFQGFGILLDFLQFLKIMGFLRTVMMISAVYLAWRVIAIVGLFDTWFNFRRFFSNKNRGEGDKL